MKRFFLKTAYLLGQESKCVSKQVGCVIAKDKRIISTGINGTPPGYKNCSDQFPNYDPKVDREKHHLWSKIYETHAEINAIAYAARNDIGIDGAELYTILQPCDDCLKSIIAAGIKKIYYVNSYDKASSNNELWDQIEYEKVEDPELLAWIEQQNKYFCENKWHDNINDINYKLVVSRIREALKDYIIEHKIKSLVLGVSGGLDSCVCAVLAKPVCDELDIPLIGRSLPTVSNTDDEKERAKRTGKLFCTEFKEDKSIDIIRRSFRDVNLNPRPSILEYSVEHMTKWKIREGNIQARLRMIYLYNIAAETSGMVLGTDNYTEYLLGFWTIHGNPGDYGMIAELWKTEVYDMAEWLANNECEGEASKIIMDTINAMATDGLGVSDGGDMEQILPGRKITSREGYKEIDKILRIWENLHTLGSTQKAIITLAYENHPAIKRYLGTAFKRNHPVNIKRKTLIP